MKKVGLLLFSIFINTVLPASVLLFFIFGTDNKPGPVVAGICYSVAAIWFVLGNIWGIKMFVEEMQDEKRRQEEKKKQESEKK